jgi:hypothetical protein
MPKGFIQFFILSVCAAIILPAVCFAQLDMVSTLSGELGVEIIPHYPKPNEEVFINLSLYTDNLNTASIAWYQDGKQVLSGKGETKYHFTAGPAGKETRIEIRINLLGGTSFTKNVVVNPAGVDLLWEANSYVPPFYKGKALHPMQGILKIVAMPDFVRNGRRISPQNLIYKWSNGVDVYQNASGYGKNSVIVDGSVLGRREEIAVLVSDPASGLVAQGRVNISPSNPQVVFYENNPYYGHLFDSAILNDFDLKGAEVQILAVPYYFTQEGRSSLQYKWRLNGQSLPDLYTSRTAVFKKPENESGRSSISLQVDNINRILQQADSGLSIIFKK